MLYNAHFSKLNLVTIWPHTWTPKGEAPFIKWGCQLTVYRFHLLADFPTQMDARRDLLDRWEAVLAQSAPAERYMVFQGSWPCRASKSPKTSKTSWLLITTELNPVLTRRCSGSWISCLFSSGCPSRSPAWTPPEDSLFLKEYLAEVLPQLLLQKQTSKLIVQHMRDNHLASLPFLPLELWHHQ